MSLALGIAPQLANAAGATNATGATDAMAQAGLVLIVFQPRTRAASQRLSQEIESLGFSVKLLPDAETSALLDRLAAESEAMAAIRVKPLDAGGVEMTVLDRATGKTVHRELTQVSASDPAGEELVATRTVELFRASLMELSADHPARGEVPPSPRVVALVRRAEEAQLRRRAGELSVAAGPALLLMPDWSPATQLWLNASWLSQLGVGLTAAVQSPLSASRLSREEGAVELSATTYRLGLLWGSRPDRLLSGRLMAGWSLSTLSVRGDATPPYLGSSLDHVAWSPWFGVGGRLRLGNHIALAVEVTGAWTLPRETIRLAGRPVADFARPACFIALGPELFWP